MPVTIRPNRHPSQPWSRGRSHTTAADILQNIDPWTGEKTEKVLCDALSEAHSSRLTPSQHGFVFAAINAYHGHHHLIIRPEDVWFAILSQLSIYINKNAESLRSFFVEHEGKVSLTADLKGGWEGAIGEFARLITENIKDPKMVPWVSPDFSTTTTNDKTVASIILMGALQAYFEYCADVTCGIPSVTLQGTKGDWIKLLDRLDYLPQLGDEAKRFQQVLTPILSRFVRHFDSPDDKKTKEFWNQIAYENHSRVCGGHDYFSGWITAFMFWNDKGQIRHGKCDHGADRLDGLHLDGIHYHNVENDKVPYGFGSVPVLIVGTGRNGRLLAGSIAIKSSCSNSNGSADQVDEPWTDDVLQPVTGWMVLLMKEDEAACQFRSEPSIPYFARADEISHYSGSQTADAKSISGATMTGSIRSFMSNRTIVEKHLRRLTFPKFRKDRTLDRLRRGGSAAP